VLAAAQGRLAAAGDWALNEKRIVERAGLESVRYRLGEPDQILPALVSGVGALLSLRDAIWT
jgi:hypothetical protein